MFTMLQYHQLLQLLKYLIKFTIIQYHFHQLFIYLILFLIILDLQHLHLMFHYLSYLFNDYQHLNYYLKYLLLLQLSQHIFQLLNHNHLKAILQQIILKYCQDVLNRILYYQFWLIYNHFNRYLKYLNLTFSFSKLNKKKIYINNIMIFTYNMYIFTNKFLYQIFL